MIKKVLCLTLIFALTISCVSTGAQANSEVSENHGVLEELKTNDVRVFGFMEALVPFLKTRPNGECKQSQKLILATAYIWTL